PSLATVSRSTDSPGAQDLSEYYSAICDGGPIVSGPTIRIGIADHDLNKPILDGTVKVEGFELDISHGTNDGEIHQLLRDGKIDACEYSFGTYMTDRARGVPFIAIPAFPNRKFRL